jgi:hypothetical protein
MEKVSPRMVLYAPEEIEMYRQAATALEGEQQEWIYLP